MSIADRVDTTKLILGTSTHNTTCGAKALTLPYPNHKKPTVGNRLFKDKLNKELAQPHYNDLEKVYLCPNCNLSSTGLTYLQLTGCVNDAAKKPLFARLCDNVD